WSDVVGAYCPVINWHFRQPEAGAARVTVVGRLCGIQKKSVALNKCRGSEQRVIVTDSRAVEPVIEWHCVVHNSRCEGCDDSRAPDGSIPVAVGRKEYVEEG